VRAYSGEHHIILRINGSINGSEHEEKFLSSRVALFM
jgi:hypothetical protein